MWQSSSPCERSSAARCAMGFSLCQWCVCCLHQDNNDDADDDYVGHYTFVSRSLHHHEEGVGAGGSWLGGALAMVDGPQASDLAPPPPLARVCVRYGDGWRFSLATWRDVRADKR